MNGGFVKKKEDVCRAVFKHLNDSSLMEMRRRKKLGERFFGKDPKAYLKYLKEIERIEKEKAKDESVEMIAEGYRKIDNYINKRKVIFS